MTNTLIAPEQEMFPNRYRWTVEACYRLMELGLIEGRNEVLDGEIVSKMGQNPAHSYTVQHLMRALSTRFGLDNLWIQSPITLPAPDHVFNEPEPDVAVTRPSEEDYASRHPGPEDLCLVVEVSDTTLRPDLIVKARLYARAGIPEYWTLDLNGRLLHVHREPNNGEYASITIHSENEIIALAAYPEATVAIADILPPSA